MNGIKAEFLPDTRAELTVVPSRYVCDTQLTQEYVTIEGATGSPERMPLAVVNLEVLGERFGKKVAVSSSMGSSNRVLYSIPLGDKLSKILFKSAGEQERQADKQQLVSVEESTCEKLTPGVTEVVNKVDARISKVCLREWMLFQVVVNVSVLNM